MRQYLLHALLVLGCIFVPRREAEDEEGIAMPQLHVFQVLGLES